MREILKKACEEEELFQECHIEKFKRTEFGDCNIVIGRNGSGKTRMLNFLKKYGRKNDCRVIFLDFSEVDTDLQPENKEVGNTLALKDIPNRIAIFLEEAHNFIPSMKSSFCKDVINAVAREGRKLGIHLVLLSQRPRYLDPTTLSQCGSMAAFNISNPDDIDYIMENANFYGEEYKSIIRSLHVGECMIASDYLENNVICKVDLFDK